MGAMIQAEDLTKVYRIGKVDVPALAGVSLSVEPGEFVSIVGPSGSGKSTLFYILGGLTGPTSGRVMIEGADFSRLSDAERTRLRRRRIGFVFQKFNLLPTLDAAGNIAIAHEIAGVNGLDRAYLEKIAQMLGIAGRLNHRPSELSGGEQQMLSMGRALMPSPRLLLLDEPSLGLAPIIVEQIAKIIKEINAQGTAILLVEQNATMALSIADYGYVLEHGRVVKDAPAPELLADRDIQEFYLGVGEAGRRSYRDVKTYRRRKRWTA